tara:strand:+ start:167 stop:346 length:180 start_codon:yes stop_codon:yes gene_type:complete
MSGKGDRNRVSNWDKFYEGYNRIFRPKYESKFRDKSSDSKIESKPFKSDPIRHDITRII